MKCFFHQSDLDGACSAAIVKKFFPEAQLVGINYGQPFPWDDIEPNEAVWMVDFCLQPFFDMIRLANMAQLVWIDHHTSAIEESISNHVNLAIPGLRAVGLAGCELTWKYIQNTVMRDKDEKEPMPLAVTLLGRYDCWDNSDEKKWNEQILPFQYGMRMLNTDPANDDVWAELLSGKYQMLFVGVTTSKGRSVLEYLRASDAKYMKATAHTIMFEGLKCLAINRLLVNSLVFESMWDPNEYDAMMAYGFRGKGWTVSLYTGADHVDVSQVAHKYGGGGHKAAAGFQCEALPWRDAGNL